MLYPTELRGSSPLPLPAPLPDSSLASVAAWPWPGPRRHPIRMLARVYAIFKQKGRGLPAGGAAADKEQLKAQAHIHPALVGYPTGQRAFLILHPAQLLGD